MANTNASRAAPPAIAVFNHKGGVAKTTTACNLAVCLAAHGYRVTLVDLDAQGNATLSFGLQPLPAVGVIDLLRGRASLDEVLVATAIPGLSLLPATTDLRTAELDLAGDDRSHTRLREALAAGGLGERADVTVVDCPPALGTMTLNALAAAAAVLIPAKPDPFSHEGLVNTWYEIKRVRESANADLGVAGILFTMAATEAAAADVARTMRAEFGEQVLSTEIAADPKVLEAQQLSLPVSVLDPDGLAGRQYFDATEELLRRLLRHHGTAPRLKAPAERDAALNTLREWRSDQIALRRLPANRGWTKPPEDAAPTASPTPLPEASRRNLGWLWALAGAAAGFAVGFLIRS